MTTNGAGGHGGTAADDARLLARSVIASPVVEQFPRSSLVLSIASVADDVPAWGQNQWLRDQRLREFWPTEPVLASAIYSIVARNTSFSWTLDGPPRTVNATLDLFHNADLGSGFLDFCQRWTTDWLTQDNGAFFELIRATDSADSPVIGIAHLDSARCRRTGLLDVPIVYQDRMGMLHRMRADQVVGSADFPSPVETMNGVGLCAVSRVLRAAQLLRDIGIYLREKVAGSNPAAIHLISGIKASEIDDAIAQHSDRQRAKGLTRYDLPTVLATLDPTATVSHEQIDLASLPDSFDLETTMRWYINQLALGFGADFQDFAPLPGRGLGSSTQSMILHEKSRGKGPALFMKTLTHLFNFHGVLPRNVTFRYDEQDAAADLEQADLLKSRAEARQIYLTTGVLTPQVVQRMMLDAAEITQDDYDELQRTALNTPAAGQDGNVTADEDEPSEKAQHTVKDSGLALGDAPADTERRTIEGEMAASMLSALQGAHAELRRRLLSEKGMLRRKEDPGALLGGSDFWTWLRQRMQAAMLPWVTRAAGAGAAWAIESPAGAGLAIDMDKVNQAVLEYSRTYLDAWWAQLETATRTYLRTAITTWQEVGLGSEGLPDLVRALEPAFGQVRANRIAVTETTRLFQQGNDQALLAGGIVESQWLTVNDEHVCPVCGPLAGRIWPIGQGETPPAHVMCRCQRVGRSNAPELRFAEARLPHRTIDRVVEKAVERDAEGRIARIVEVTHEQGMR